VLILKGFRVRSEVKAYLEEAEDLEPQAMVISDAGFDITAYYEAAQSTGFQTLLFLNSFSEILAPNWLSIFSDGLRSKNTAMVGATGSFESIASSAVMAAANEQRSFLRFSKTIRAEYLKKLFPPFPNAHIRTNAFMIDRQDFLGERRAIRSKLAALRFESGWQSLTRCFLSRGRRVALVDRFGQAYEPSSWPPNELFRVGSQSRLIVADNQTKTYDSAEENVKAELRSAAWGDVPCHQV
jgi:hypothetical protein